MAEGTNDLALGYMMASDNKGGYCGNGGGLGGLGDMNGILGLAALGLIFGDGFGNLGGGRNNGAPATQADLAAGFNNSTVLSSLDDIKLGQANAINYNNQGFAGLNTSILQGFHGVDNAVCTLGYQTQSGFNSLGSQMAKCCCDIERGIDGVNYNMASHFCNLGNTIQSNTRDIIDNANCNTRAILDFLTNDKIESLRSENEALRLKASQSAQNQYLIDQLRPCPVPAYITCNPFSASWGTGYSGCGNNGCGCGCG